MRTHLLHITDPFCPIKSTRAQIIETDSNTSINELIRLGQLTFESPTFCVVNDQCVLRAQWDDIIEVSDSIVSFVALPHGGDGGSNPLKIVLMVVVMVAAVYTGGAASAFAANSLGFGASAASAFGAVAGSIVTTAGSLIVNAVLPQPSVGGSMAFQSSIGQPSTIYSIEAQGNSLRIGQPIAEIFGEHVVFPAYLAQPYYFFSDNDQFVDTLLAIGEGYYDISEPKLGRNDFSNFGSNIAYVVYPPDTVVDKFYKAVYNGDTANSEMVPFVYAPQVIVCPPDATVTKLQFDFVCGAGLYYANDQGGMDSLTVSFLMYATPIDLDGNPIGAEILVGTQSITGATNTPIRRSYEVSVPSGRYQARVIRTNAEVTSRAGHKIYWTGLSGITEGSKTYDFTTVWIRMKASEGISQNLQRQINFKVVRKLHVWSQAEGWSLVRYPTRNPAWALAYMANKIGLPDSMILLSKLEQLAAVWNSRGDWLDLVFDTPSSFFEASQQAARVGRAQVYLQGGVVCYVRDELVTMSKCQFSSRNIKRGSFSIEYILPTSDFADEVEVEYFSMPHLAWKSVKSDVFTVTPTNCAIVRLLGCTNRAQAYREACFMSASNQKRRKRVSFNTEMEGYLPSLNSLITVSHDVVRWGRCGDVVAWNSGTRVLRGSEPFEFKPGTNYIALRRRNGSEDGPIAVIPGFDEFSVILTELPDFTPDVGQNKYQKTQYNFGVGGAVGIPCKVELISPINSTDVAIVAVTEDLSVHSADGSVPPVDVPGWDDLPTYDLGRPDIGYIWAVQSGTPEVPRLNISWNPAVGAHKYIVEYSYDTQLWTRLVETAGTEVSFIPEFGLITIRAAGYGVAMGEWKYWSGVISSTIPPGAVDSITSINGTQGSSWSISWSAAVRAEKYRVVVEVVGFIKREIFTRDTNFHYTSTMQEGDGGPWRSVVFKVWAVNSSGESTLPAVLNAENEAPSFENFSPAVVEMVEAIKVDWSANMPVETDISHFYIYCSTNSAAVTAESPAALVGSTDRHGHRFTIDNLLDNVVYYIAVVPYDTFGRGEPSNIVSGKPFAYGQSGTSTALSQSVGISDSESTLQATLDELYDRKYSTGGPVYNRTGNPASDFWIEFDYGVGFLIDLVQLYVDTFGARVYISIDTTGRDEWKWFGAVSSSNHSLASGELVEKVDQATARSHYWSLLSEENQAMLPPRTPGKRCRVYFTGSGLAAPHQIHECRFERQVNAEQIYAEKLSAITAYLGVVKSPNYVPGDEGMIIDLEDVALELNKNGVTKLKYDSTTGLLTLRGAITVESGSAGYENLSDKPTSLSNISSLEGIKLTGIQSGATRNEIVYSEGLPFPPGNEGDYCIDTSDGNQIYIHNGTDWITTKSGDDSIAVLLDVPEGFFFKNNSGVPKVVRADVYIGGELKSDIAHSTYQYRWTVANQVVYVDVEGNYVQLSPAFGLYPADPNEPSGLNFRSIIVEPSDVINDYKLTLNVAVSNIP